MLYSEPELQLTEDEFRLIRDLIYNHCGLYFDSDSKYLLDRRLLARVAHHNLSGFREYYQFLKYDRRKDEEISDISQRVVQHARKGVYTKSSFRCTDERYLKRFFTPVEEGGYRICDQVRELVTISHMNLFDVNRLALLGKMDLIFCRNVIIYFDQDSKKRVIDSFYNTLRGSGYLLLGHSESLMNLTTAFSLRHLKNDMVYQKPAVSFGGAIL